MDDDRTVLRPSPGGAGGAPPDSDRTVLRPRPGGGMGGGMPPAGDDSTVLRPRPGGRGPTAPAPVPRQTVQVRGSGLNPIVDASTGLLTLISQLRNTMSHPNIDGLRAHVAHQIQSFDVTARNAGASPEMVLAARYSLCTLVDETVLRTPWGMESSWAQQSTLSQFHNETFGGEKFFLMLERAIQEPARNLALLEFQYLCIAFGLEGRYGVQDGGRTRLAQVQDNLFRTIRLQRGDFERELSPRWHGVQERRNRLTRYVPLWVVAALAGALLLSVYMGFTYYLTQAADPVFSDLAKIGRSQMQAATVEPVERTVSLRELLADDISQGLISVDETNVGTKISIKGDGLFALGSANVTEQVVPLLVRIAKALDKFPGRILITGHTDSTKVSLRMKVKFPSNWHLSQARAESVAKLIAANIKDTSRIVAEGRGATEPIASNDTKEGRAKNRRVEITLMRKGASV